MKGVHQGSPPLPGPRPQAFPLLPLLQLLPLKYNYNFPKAGSEELSKELDLDLTEAGEPQEHLPDAEITEEEREEAVRRYQRELREKGRR